MSQINQITLQPGIPQSFGIVLGGIPYVLALNYRNVPNGGWVLDIADSNKIALAFGIPLVTGVNLLAQYRYLGFGGGLWVQTLTDPDAVPTFVNLGTDGLLYWVSP